VLPEVVEHVHERVAYLSLRAQEPRVVSVSLHASGASQRVIHGLGYADSEAAYSTLELRRPAASTIRCR